jgi:hypothetical protein
MSETIGQAVPSVEIMRTEQENIRAAISGTRGNRILAAALVAAGQTKIKFDGRELNQIERVSQMIWGLVLDGEVVFPDGRVCQVDDVESWVLVIKWLFEHIDGKVPVAQAEAPASNPTIRVQFVDDSSIR